MSDQPGKDEPKDDPKPPGKQDGPKPVPYERFQEVNTRMKELETQLTEFKAGQTKAEEDRLADQAKWKELAEKRENELAELRASLEAKSLEALRLQVAGEMKFPAELATRLQGKTIDELKSDAEKMAAFLKPTTPGIPPAPPRGGAGSSITAEQMADPKWVRENKEKIMDAYRKGELP
jgi:hypothetical protein